MRRALLGLILIAGVVMQPATAPAKGSRPVATVSLSGKSVAAGVGFEWGSGTLHYKGKSYPFKVEGLEVGDVGVTTVTATGNVYHLKRLDDFAGQYTAAAAGAAAGGGGTVGTMRNANDVVMNLKATTRGAELKAGVDGIKITLK